MKYRIFFAGLLLYNIYFFRNSVDPFRYLLLWLMCSLCIMTLSYVFHAPKLVCGKQENGKVNFIIITLNLPWLLFTWTIWLIESAISREDKFNQIGDTNIHIGRYPLFTKEASSFGLIIDLTCEFPKCGKQKEYICLPNLDGVALKNYSLPYMINAEQKVLIHCAQGHGRSGTFATILMNQLNEQITKDAAYETIMESRPRARLSEEQKKQLKD